MIDLSLLAGIADLLTGSGQLILAILGIAFLIFIHEGGHFLAAKWCGVRVEVFSLGFGKRLWGFERGDTDYRISLLPLGGYVQMLGQDDTDPSAPATDSPDDFRNKTIAQRALIMIGGVAVNALFAIVAFILAFWLGVPFRSPEIGYAARGRPADGKLQSGDRVLAINGEEMVAFADIQQSVAFSAGKTLEFKIARRVGGETKTLTVPITPKPDENGELLSIGVKGLQVIAGIEQDSEAWQAGFRNDDRILRYKNAKGQWTDCSNVADLMELALGRPGGVIAVEVERPTLNELGIQTGVEKTFKAEMPCLRRNIWKVGLQFRPPVRVGLVLPSTPAEEGGLKPDDQVLAMGGVAVTASDLPTTLQQVCADALARKQATFPVKIRRQEDGKSVEKTLDMPVPEPRGLDRRFTLGFQFGEDMISTVTPNSAIAKVNAERVKADSQARIVQSGDRLVSVKTKKVWGFRWKGVGGADDGSNARSLELALQDVKDKPIQLTFRRGDDTFSLVVKGEEDKDDAVGVLPMAFTPRQILVRRGLVGALSLGLYSTNQTGQRIVLMLRSLIVSRDVSVKKLGGPIGIVRAATTVADHGPGKMIWFLALLSVNLAVLNILPIPVLDGGHLMFLGIEWLKGGPVSENVLIYAQWAGLFLILGLIITVSFNDILRLWTTI